MSAEDNKALVRRFFDEVWSQGDFDVLDELFSDDYQLHVMWHNPMAGGSGDAPRGPEGARPVISGWRDAVPDLTVTVDEQVADGDMVVSRHMSSGVPVAPLMGVPASGKRIDMSGITFTRVENGKLAEAWTCWDMLGLMQQLGAAPKLGEGPPPGVAAPAGHASS